MSKIIRICFVCLGNIVRSPLAENMFRYLAEQAGAAHKYELDSAGTSDWHIGEQPDSRMRRVAARHGFRYDGRSRQFEHRDFDNFDLIIAMDASNQSDLLRMAKTSEHRAKLRLMREFDPYGGPSDPVPDPYYGGIDGFEDVFAIVKRSCQGLLTALEDGTVSS
ncbi:MAG: low molecular weight phosphotyrosine protein phosphatase [Chloroflexi bacterium]|nr:low molecular weight phosphotyrosine protein phosphatase [Chloroflexota bacterium]